MEWTKSFETDHHQPNKSTAESVFVRIHLNF